MTIDRKTLEGISQAGSGVRDVPVRNPDGPIEVTTLGAGDWAELNGLLLADFTYANLSVESEYPRGNFDHRVYYTRKLREEAPPGTVAIVGFHPWRAKSSNTQWSYVEAVALIPRR